MELFETARDLLRVQVAALKYSRPAATPCTLCAGSGWLKIQPWMPAVESHCGVDVLRICGKCAGRGVTRG